MSNYVTVDPSFHADDETVIEIHSDFAFSAAALASFVNSLYYEFGDGPILVNASGLGQGVADLIAADRPYRNTPVVSLFAGEWENRAERAKDFGG